MDRVDLFMLGLLARSHRQKAEFSGISAIKAPADDARRDNRSRITVNTWAFPYPF